MAKQPRSISGKVAVVTGGGRGIGRATAQALARRGARVAIGDVDLATAERTAQELGGGMIALALDVSDRPGFTAFLDEVERRLGPLDILVNNAGIMPIGPFEEEEDATVIRQLEINLHGVIHGTKEAVRRMRPRRTGHVVNLASVAGVAAIPGGATYCATKHGVVGLTEAVRLELRGTGVEVSYVCPGHVRTELTAGVEENRSIPPITPEEVAEAIAGVIEVPRPRVFVPATLKVPVTLTALLPRRVGEGISKLLKADRALLDYDRKARAAYERRAAESAPAAEDVVAEHAA
ncbi:MAG: SDR family oxidoreductase [Actinomycetota bacterium]|nr:SDR family oxidoreductase [Actinomycetota bacterium]